jgi:hypothetical protein
MRRFWHEVAQIGFLIQQTWVLCEKKATPEGVAINKGVAERSPSAKLMGIYCVRDTVCGAQMQFNQI